MHGVITHDQMPLKMFWRFAIDLFEELQPLLLTLDTTDRASLKIIQRSEQGDHAKAEVIGRVRKHTFEPQRQTRLRVRSKT